MSEYKTKILNTVHYIEIPLIVGSKESQSFDLQSKAWLSLAVDVHIFDFKNAQKIDGTFYDYFNKFKVAAEAKNFNVVSLNMTPAISKLFGNEKISDHAAFVNKLQKPQAKDSDVDRQTWMVKYIIVAARTAMNTLFNTTVAADENYRQNYKDFRPEEFYRVAYIGATAPSLSVELRLFFEKKTLVALTQILLPSYADLTEEITDSTAAELLNLIYAGAKSKINEDRGYNLPPAIPRLIQIKKSEAQARIAAHNLVLIPMVTPVGTYYLEIDFGTK